MSTNFLCNFYNSSFHIHRYRNVNVKIIKKKKNRKTKRIIFFNHISKKKNLQNNSVLLYLQIV
jgi:hypothetical protein